MWYDNRTSTDYLFNKVVILPVCIFTFDTILFFIHIVMKYYSIARAHDKSKFQKNDILHNCASVLIHIRYSVIAMPSTGAA